MKRVLGVLTAILVAACSQSPAHPTVDSFSPCSPVAGLDDPDLPAEARATIREAQEDFCAVLANREPLHAKRVLSPATTKKHGSTYYSGRGYRLVMHRDSFEAGGAFFGYYGPVLHFESRTGAAGPGQLSQVRIVRLPPVR